jgi:ABC-type uncharacterized transport system permease subunit
MQPLWLGSLSILLYLATSAGLTLRLTRGHDQAAGGRAWLLLLGFGAVALHGLALYPELVTGHGLNLRLVNAASLVALLTAALLLLTAINQPVENLGIPLLPVSAATLLLLLLNPGSDLLLNEGNWRLDLHILFSILAYSVLALGALQALLLAVQDRHLHNRHPGGFVRALPPLAVMEHMLFQMLATGFALLSAALLTGIFFLEDIFAQHLVHKTVLSIIAWVVFGILLWGRWRYGWRGRTAIRWTLSGFAFLLLAYFGTKIVLELILHRV